MVWPSQHITHNESKMAQMHPPDVLSDLPKRPIAAPLAKPIVVLGKAGLRHTNLQKGLYICERMCYRDYIVGEIAPTL